MEKNFTIALVGNPNCGKTSIFNALTGARQHVGNWPGVTVEKKEGTVSFNGNEISVIDLPGAYSLSASSEDEMVAVNYILQEKPDVVVNVIDSANLERNLYFTLQLIEMDTNVIIALNMTDEAVKKNIFINTAKLRDALGLSVVTTVATKNKGIWELLETSAAMKVKPGRPVQPDYWQTMNRESGALAEALVEEGIAGKESANLVAVRLLEDEAFAQTQIAGCPTLEKLADKEKDRITSRFGLEPGIYLADQRYIFIGQIIKDCVRRETPSQRDLTEMIDRVVTNKWIGIPLFFVIMFLLYQITMGLGNNVLGGYVDSAFGILGRYVSGLLVNAPVLAKSFVSDALIGGVGSVLVFVPMMFTMYFLISFLEDSGYMARAAYVMDRLMNAVGLHGKTAVAMIVGSGCNMAGIMSTRTLDSRKDRMIGILISPFISCSARLPVYALFAGAFFRGKTIGIIPLAGLVIFSLYLLGIMVAVAAGKILSETLFKQKKSYFVMELPPYRLPTLKSLIQHMWEKTESFVRKAGTVILGIVVLIWILSVFPVGVEPGSTESLLGKLGAVIAPVLSPAGFGSWQASVALLVGIGAKEAIIATFGLVYGTGEGMLGTVLAQHFTPLSAYAFMVMTLLYSPCAATIGIIKKETNSVKWTLFSVLYSLIIGWIAAVLIFQLGSLFI
ncbi:MULTISPECIES: ferrous iron transport protein B [Dehalobacter]|jgi:ferrous iron transport protein B|uniref:Ferrous iron transport protein B n=1 Tax=Dehalobacter restrictus TaxID=55583 RepID=A0A857DLY9_9FIRM|nr:MULTISPECIES: ferrous iron transport protein B [Dehalobacter]MCG1025466.1 ferrous iron transport protein B [Dehalobacter sp.]OCZ54742.1 ferrous iron transport protein B [Dehalobacter sp. TeCB1]QHA01395.1 ferrous iron transport protein B [Dehalobacter restrictus]